MHGGLRFLNSPGEPDQAPVLLVPGTTILVGMYDTRDGLAVARIEEILEVLPLVTCLGLSTRHLFGQGGQHES